MGWYFIDFSAIVTIVDHSEILESIQINLNIIDNVFSYIELSQLPKMKAFKFKILMHELIGILATDTLLLEN